MPHLRQHAARRPRTLISPGPSAPPSQEVWSTPPQPHPYPQGQGATAPNPRRLTAPRPSIPQVQVPKTPIAGGMERSTPVPPSISPGARGHSPQPQEAWRAAALHIQSGVPALPVPLDFDQGGACPRRLKIVSARPAAPGERLSVPSSRAPAPPAERDANGGSRGPPSGGIFYLTFPAARPILLIYIGSGGRGKIVPIAAPERARRWLKARLAGRGAWTTP